MKMFGVSLLTIALCLSLNMRVEAEDSRLEPTSGALMTMSGNGVWNAGIRLQRDRRQFQTDNEIPALDINHMLFRLGASPLSFLNLWAEVGVSVAESDSEKGDTGMEWGAGAYLRLADFAIESSPVVGLKKAISIGVDFSYTECESNFEEDDLGWSEWRINPLFSYIDNRKGDARWFFYGPEAIALRAGPVFVRNDGDYGDSSLEEDRDFGGRVVFDLLWSSGWVTSLDATFLGGKERQIGLAVNKNF